jgi:hypothetical protein
MRIGRKIVVSAIVSLGVAGSIFASSAVAVTPAVAAGHSTVYYHS